MNNQRDIKAKETAQRNLRYVYNKDPARCVYGFLK